MTRLSIGRCGVGLVLLAILACASRMRPHPLLINETHSLPRGLYGLLPGRSPGRGAVVALRPPKSARAYLRALGAPPDLSLLKRVAAEAGDPVCARAGEIRLPGRRLRASAYDRRGRRLPAWAGCGVLPAGQVFLLGDSADSFDSRYFGPVARGDLEGVYQELLTW